jgi:5-methyltetrahydropteroyltriglutamate--homocysteine methyltransferase
MKTSQDRILTTHVGSLPRTQAVLEILERHETRADATEPAFDPVVQQAVLDNVRRQLDVGIDIVSDGEASKISYAT